MDLKRSWTESSPPNSQDSSNNAKRQRTSTAASLCTICKDVDLEKMFEAAGQAYQKARDGRVIRQTQLYSIGETLFFYDDALAVHVFHDRLSKATSCPLCLFFKSLRVQPEKHERFKLLAFCSSDSSTFNLPLLKESEVYNEIRHTVLMAVVPDIEDLPLRAYEEFWLQQDIPSVGFAFCLPSDEYGGQKIPLLEARELNQQVDFSLVREWLDFCQTHHGKACDRLNGPSTIDRGFRVIDCSVSPPTVVPMTWGVAYVALSYVWGQRPQDLVEWPKTVLDAVLVTRELGQKYLWVDRLCINQSDADEKAYLISRMTTIYEEADFTIVSASGSGAADGLPGVHGSPRKSQPKCELKSGGMLLSTLPDPRQEILQSDYWTRGWTYQEGVLSNRRVVFTEHQVYWECRCMAVHESIKLPLRLVHEASNVAGEKGLRMADYMLTGIFKGKSYSGGAMSDQKDLVIQDDNQRVDYGFPDYRNGTILAHLRGLNEHIPFLGIVGMFKGADDIYLYLGIPMWMNDILGDLTGAYVTFALSISSWYHRASSQHSMFVNEACRRRHHLPSWTWAGWEGTVTWRAPPSDEHCVIMSDIIESDGLHLVWAADIYLRSTYKPVSIRLLNTYSTEQLEKEVPTLMEIRGPLLLRYANRHEIEGSWEWRRLAGKPGGDQFYAEQLSWDKKWYRIGGRLATVNLSISLTEAEWTAKHSSGELISVLIFAAKFPSIGHGRARFLTLRRVESTSYETRWERVGTLQLTIPQADLDKCLNNDQLLEKLPVKWRKGAIVIQ